MKNYLIILLVMIPFLCVAEGTLFVGLESSDPPTYFSDLEGFPNISWTAHFSHNVSGAAATPDGRIYLCEGAFTTHLYQASLELNPTQLCTIEEDMSALAYGRDTLWGYSNYATPRGIYSIDTGSGEVELALDVGGYRFFGLDYNPEDDLFYGYTEYGGSGLYSINIDTGEMIQLTGSIPATNGQGRGLAVGDNTAFLTATRGDDGIPYFAYDLSQGAGGEWVEFPNAYPEYHSTGGAAWIAAPDENSSVSGQVVSSDSGSPIPGCLVTLTGETTYETETDEEGYFLIEEVLNNNNYDLEIYKEGYELYEADITIELEDIDLGVISLQEIPYPPENVEASETVLYQEVTITWSAPGELERMLEGYNVYRFLECFNAVPDLWELLIEETAATIYVDEAWAELPENLWQYAVEAIYTNGIYSEPVLSNPLQKIVTENNPDNVIAGKISLNSAYPNPFNPEVTVSYSLKQTATVELNVYNIRGELVKGLVSKEQEAGDYLINWQGKDKRGEAQASGVYIISLKAGDEEPLNEKVVLSK